MTLPNPRLVLSLLGAALLVACGSPGTPIPPSLELPKPVTNLRAARKGNKVILTWFAPTQTTDRHNIRRSGETLICRDLAPMKQCASIGQVPFQVPSTGNKKAPSSYTDQIPEKIELQNPLANLYYAVSVQNSYRRSAGLSNQVQVPAALTLAAPLSFQAQLMASGVHLTWSASGNVPEIQGLRFVYRVYRRNTATKVEAMAGEVPVENSTAPEFLDTGIEWEKTYEYRLTVTTFVTQPNGGEEEVEGDDTPPVTITTHDVFPPASPSGLQAVFSGPGQKPFIDLIWTANTEADLAGYNVYRREEGTQPEKINSELVKSPAYRDSSVLPGHSYTYSVSAVDARGNESPRSEQASESVPSE